MTDLNAVLHRRYHAVDHHTHDRHPSLIVDENTVKAARRQSRTHLLPLQEATWWTLKVASCLGVTLTVRYRQGHVLRSEYPGNGAPESGEPAYAIHSRLEFASEAPRRLRIMTALHRGWCPFSAPRTLSSVSCSLSRIGQPFNPHLFTHLQQDRSIV